MSVTEEKSKSFAIRIVRLYQYLKDEKNEYVLSKQLLRSGTSVGANLSEAKYAISRNDFITKQYIALKEVSETLYWLELLFKTDYLSQEQYDSIYQDAEELRKLLSSSTKTLQATKNNEWWQAAAPPAGEGKNGRKSEKYKITVKEGRRECIAR